MSGHAEVGLFDAPRAREAFGSKVDQTRGDRDLPPDVFRARTQPAAMPPVPEDRAPDISVSRDERSGGFLLRGSIDGVASAVAGTRGINPSGRAATDQTEGNSSSYGCRVREGQEWLQGQRQDSSGSSQSCDGPSDQGDHADEAKEVLRGMGSCDGIGRCTPGEGLGRNEGPDHGRNEVGDQASREEGGGRRQEDEVSSLDRLGGPLSLIEQCVERRPDLQRDEEHTELIEDVSMEETRVATEGEGGSPEQSPRAGPHGSATPSG